MTQAAKNALQLLALLAVGVFVGEMLVMLALQYVVFEDALTEAIADATALTVLLFPFLYYVVFRSVLRKNERLAKVDAALRRAKTHLEVKVEERTQALLRINSELEESVDILSAHQREMVILGEMSQIFQVCRNLDEAYKVAGHQLRRLFNDNPGALYLFRSSRNVLERVTHWNAGDNFEEFFMPDECWGLRRGKLHDVAAGDYGIKCEHSNFEMPGRHVCLPMIADGEILGVLTLVLPEKAESGGELPRQQQKFLNTLAKNMALAVSNIRLREMLRMQALRDKLTGLYNRRYVDEAFKIELNRANRKDEPLSVIMFDIDHFKRFNDKFGHEAGDVVLARLGNHLHENARTSDITCRYGGEEFLVILVNATTEQAVVRADALRQGIEELTVSLDGETLAHVSVSCGVATFGIHGNDSKSLIHSADVALYEAKRQGRNCVVQATESESQDLLTAAS